MKNIFSIGITALSLLFYSCGGSDDGSFIDIPSNEISKDITVSNYSEVTATIGQELFISGINFPTDLSQVNIFLDDQKVEILSATTTQYKIKIPEVTTALPVLIIDIPNSFVSYGKDYKGITILDTTKNKWIEIKTNLPSINEIQNFRAIGKEKIHFNLKEDDNSIFDIYRSFNGGISIIPRPNTYSYSDTFGGAYFLNTDESEYSLTPGVLFFYSKDEQAFELQNFKENSSTWLRHLYASKDGKEVIVGTAEGRVYKSSDSGNTFLKIHENNPSVYEFDAFFALSASQVWFAGYTYPFGPSVNEDFKYYPAKILVLKEDGNWYNQAVRLEIKDGNFETITKIHFTDSVTGYATAQIANLNTGEERNLLIKSETKGDNWEVVREANSKIVDFSFKDKSTGWYISGKEIYETVDGGTTWSLKYTNDTDCKGILYNEGVIWVIANEKILKYYL